MGFFGRIGKAFGAGALRTKIGGTQGVLRLHLEKSPLDSPRIDELVSEITKAAWSISSVSGFFQSLGFSYDDYDAMYRAALVACPNKLHGHNLIATTLMIDRYNGFESFFKEVANAASNYEGAERRDVLSALMSPLAADLGNIQGMRAL